MSIVFITGFPGFLGTELVPRLLSRDDGARALCLVQPKFAELARQRADELGRAHPAIAGRIDLVEGDITAPGLGLDRSDRSKTSVDRRAITEVYHLAALYDLTTPRGPAMAVNVDGTRHVLDFAEECSALERFQYVSTCYVSGRTEGLFTEHDLDVSQHFNNFYEESKFLAEVEVQSRMKSGFPATVYRPAIVTGDSRTGATQKYDGPYFVIRWLLKQPAAMAVLPMVGRPHETVVNVIPRDFVTEALVHLSGLEESKGKVYQLADPNPLTVAQMVSVLAEATGRRVVKVPLPTGVAKFSLDHVPFVGSVMGIPAAAIDYYTHPTRYSTSVMEEDLEGTQLSVPPFASYAPRLAEFVRAHPEISSKPMA